MRKMIAVFALLASCEPFPNEADAQQEDAKIAFERWKDFMIAGKVRECLEMMTLSLRSQWVYDRMNEGDHTALMWKTRLQGGARTDLDLWYSQAGLDTTRGRVTTLPGSVLADPSLTPLLLGYLQDAQPEIARDFKQLKVTQVSTDQMGVTVVIRNRANEPEIYGMVDEGGSWKVDGHRKRAPR